jgi:hypothetical protein
MTQLSTTSAALELAFVESDLLIHRSRQGVWDPSVDVRAPP